MLGKNKIKNINKNKQKHKNNYTKKFANVPFSDNFCKKKNNKEVIDLFHGIKFNAPSGTDVFIFKAANGT